MNKHDRLAGFAKYVLPITIGLLAISLAFYNAAGNGQLAEWMAAFGF